jgi:hypothetical protein
MLMAENPAPPPLSGRREDWLAALADELYGPVAAPPASLRIAREQLPDAHAERLVLTIDGFVVDACLWLPPVCRGIIAGLDFLGPVGTLTSDAFPLDPHAIVARPAWRDGAAGPLDDSLRGAAMHRFPVDLILGAGWGVLTSCYGSWVPDDPERWRTHGLVPLLGGTTGALGLWAWALSRLVDVAAELGHTRVALAGHSRLGKAALWAAANDTRVAAVLANDSGCAGAALEAHPGGETLADLRARFPHWVLPERARTVDQHQLLAAIAPRLLYVAAAADDAWSDPAGQYLALTAAARAWEVELPEPDPRPGAAFARGPLGWHLRPGGHEILPYDWRRYLAFLNRHWP